MTGPASPTPSRSRRAALLYLKSKRAGEEFTIRDAAERYGISVSSVHQALDRIRRDEAEARADERERERQAWPEDEVTL